MDSSSDSDDEPVATGTNNQLKKVGTEMYSVESKPKGLKKVETEMYVQSNQE